MRCFLLIFFVLSPVIACAASPCPAQIGISESTKVIPPGFRVFLEDGTKERLLIGMEFYVGKLDISGLLIPDPIKKFQTIWQFPKVQPIWIICDYQDTDLTLAREMPSETSSCTVTLSDPQNGALTGQRLVSSTKCW